MKKLLLITLSLIFVTLLNTPLATLASNLCEDSLSSKKHERPLKTLMKKLKQDDHSNKFRNHLIALYVRRANAVLDQYFQVRNQIIGLEEASQHITAATAKGFKEYAFSLHKEALLIDQHIETLEINKKVLKLATNTRMKFLIEEFKLINTPQRPIGFLKDINNFKDPKKELEEGNFLEAPYGRNNEKNPFGFIPQNRVSKEIAPEKQNFIGFIPQTRSLTPNKQGFIGFLKPKNIDVPYSYGVYYNKKTGYFEVDTSGRQSPRF